MPIILPSSSEKMHTKDKGYSSRIGPTRRKSSTGSRKEYNGTISRTYLDSSLRKNSKVDGPRIVSGRSRRSIRSSGRVSSGSRESTLSRRSGKSLETRANAARRRSSKSYGMPMKRRTSDFSSTSSRRKTDSDAVNHVDDYEQPVVSMQSSERKRRVRRSQNADRIREAWMAASAEKSIAVPSAVVAHVPENLGFASGNFSNRNSTGSVVIDSDDREQFDRRATEDDGTDTWGTAPASEQVDVSGLSTEPSHQKTESTLVYIA